VIVGFCFGALHAGIIDSSGQGKKLIKIK